ncbi:MAG: cytochrome c biogenesis protein CcdA [Gemmatimonadota bacterium]
MTPIDDWISQLGGGPWTVLLVAILLGLRHATDPDHIAAVSTLVLGDRKEGARRARVLGTAWGLGHGLTLFLFGLPVVLFRKYLPGPAQQGAEIAIGAIIVILAVRLLLRWRRGEFHAHPHLHQGVRHEHPHLHEHADHAVHTEVHQHAHAEAIGRSPFTAFGIGLVHGIGGSAGAGILLVSAAPTTTSGVVALLLFALGTAFSMTLITAVFGAILGQGSVARKLDWLIPALGTLSLCFGVWYGWEALTVLSR